MSTVDPTAERFMQRMGGDRPGDNVAWIADVRQQAAASLAANGLPHTRIEDWKYTSIKPITKRDFARPDAQSATADAAAVEALRIPGLDTHRLVFINGHLAASLSDRGAGGDGLRLRSLAATLAEDPEVLRDRFATLAPSDFSGFTALNTAYADDGAVIEVAPKARIDKPIELVFVSTHQDEPVAAQPRVIVHGGNHAEFSLIEHFVGLDDATNLTNVVTEIDLDVGARMTHHRLQRESRKGFHIGSIHVRQADNSRYESHNIQIGGQLSRTDINTDLNAEGAETLFNGLYLLNGRQHSDTHTRINHNKPHTYSEESYRGILNDRSRGVFNGRVYVAKDAQQIQAYQQNDNLLLSGSAEIDTKPELEIYADDVVCSHGATVGRLDEMMLFYLRSRGVDEEAARGLLLYAFAEVTVNKMGLEALQTWLQGFVIDELPQSERVREFV